MRLALNDLSMHWSWSADIKAKSENIGSFDGRAYRPAIFNPALPGCFTVTYLNELQNFVILRLIDDRTKTAFWLVWVTNLDLLSTPLQLLMKSLSNAAVYQHTGSSAADLPRSPEAPKLQSHSCR